jgi:hypothetical protein
VTNALSWFELPVTDLDRAGDFYTTVLGRKLSSATHADGRRFRIFVSDDGVTGAIVQGEGYIPTRHGALNFLNAGEYHWNHWLRQTHRWLSIAFTVKNISVDIPLGVLAVVTGVAGSGKSSLIHGSVSGRDEVVSIDQTPIRGPRRSNPATYTV